MAEVPFCGHATIALGVVLGTGADDEARYRLSTRSGMVGLRVSATASGPPAALTSVETSHVAPPSGLVPTVLELLEWRGDELEDRLPPAVAFARARHLVLAAADRATLSRLDYDFDELQRLMLEHDLTTLQLVWRRSADTFQARDPFRVGGVVEDPATGAAAAALGGYLRTAGLVAVPATITIHQGVDMGRPSELTVRYPPAAGSPSPDTRYRSTRSAGRIGRSPVGVAGRRAVRPNRLGRRACRTGENRATVGPTRSQRSSFRGVVVVTQSEVDRKPSTGSTAADGWVRSQPLLAFGVLAFALSWTFWLGSYLTAGVAATALFFVGGLGPAAAAAIVAWKLGTLQPWLGRVLRWRVSPWFYVFAVGFPAVLYATPNLVLALFGAQPDLSLVAERMPAYAATWITTVFLGGLEEPGWRGFALPRLEQRYTPVRATLLLGAVWGLWHLPVQPLAIVVTIPLAFFYTWLFNRTHSALLCILLHASITPAQEHLTLVADSPTADLAILGTLIAAAVGFVVATRGRLGRSEAAPPPHLRSTHGVGAQV